MSSRHVNLERCVKCHHVKKPTRFSNGSNRCDACVINNPAPQPSPSLQEQDDGELVRDEENLIRTLIGIKQTLSRYRMTQRAAAERISSLVEAAKKEGLRYDYLSAIHANIPKGWSEKYYVMEKIYFEGKRPFHGVNLDAELRRVKVRFHTHTSSDFHHLILSCIPHVHLAFSIKGGETTK